MTTGTRDTELKPHQQMRELIAQYVAVDSALRSPEYAHIAGHRITVANIITALLFHGGDYLEVARDYSLPTEAIKAAVWYYGLHKHVIDARMTLDAAQFPASPNDWR